MNTPKLFGELWYITLFWFCLAGVYIIILISVINYVGSYMEAVDFIIPITILFLTLGLFSKDERTFRKSKYMLKLIIRVLLKRNTRSIYKTDISDLKKLYKIESIEPTGLIRYTDRSSAYMFLLINKTVPSDELDAHNMLMKSVVESIHGKFYIKIYKISILQKNTDLQTEIVKDLQNEDLDPKQREHLIQIHKHSDEHRTPIIDFEDLGILHIPVTDTVEQAEVQGQDVIAGLSDGYKRLGTSLIVLVDKNLVANQLRQMALPIPRR